MRASRSSSHFTFARSLARSVTLLHSEHSEPLDQNRHLEFAIQSLRDLVAAEVPFVTQAMERVRRERCGEAMAVDHWMIRWPSLSLVLLIPLPSPNQFHRYPDVGRTIPPTGAPLNWSLKLLTHHVLARSARVRSALVANPKPWESARRIVSIYLRAAEALPAPSQSACSRIRDAQCVSSGQRLAAGVSGSSPLASHSPSVRPLGLSAPLHAARGL